MSKLDKIHKVLGKETIEEMDALDTGGLDTRIVQASAAIQEASDELQKNPAYLGAKSDLKDLSSGKREVNKRQRAIIEYALMRKNADDNQS